MAHYLAYWKPETAVVNDEGNPSLDHAASNQFGKVKPGDILWIVTSEGPGDLVLVGRLKVDKVVGQLEAERLTGSRDLWEADYHVICHSPEEKIYLDLSSRASRLSFEGAVDSLPEGFTGQHLQTMRRLDYHTEQYLEQLWARRNEVEDQAAGD